MNLEDARVAVGNAVLAHYLETGCAVDVAQLVARLDWSESRVRWVLREAGGAVDGTSALRAERPRYSKSYGGQVGISLVWTWLPTLARLRDELLACRAARLNAPTGGKTA